MKSLSITALILTMLFVHSLSFSQDPKEGEKLFNSNCKACHSIGKGKIVGPDLKGVNERRTKEWLHAFIPEPMKMIQSGDAVATKLFEEHNKIPMPDQTYLKAAQIDDILAFVQEQGAIVAEEPKEVKKEVVTENKKEIVEAKAQVNLSPMEYFVYGMVAACFVLVTVVLLLIFQLTKSLQTFEKNSTKG